MVRQEQTYFTNTDIEKEYKEYINGELTIHKEYDIRGNLLYRAYPIANNAWYKHTYDDRGNEVTYIDNLGGDVKYIYDKENILIERQEKNVILKYDKTIKENSRAGNVIYKKIGNRIRLCKYDNQNRIIYELNYYLDKDNTHTKYSDDYTHYTTYTYRSDSKYLCGTTWKTASGYDKKTYKKLLKNYKKTYKITL